MLVPCYKFLLNIPCYIFKKVKKNYKGITSVATVSSFSSSLHILLSLFFVASFQVTNSDISPVMRIPNVSNVYFSLIGVSMDDHKIFLIYLKNIYIPQGRAWIPWSWACFHELYCFFETTFSLKNMTQLPKHTNESLHTK